MFNFFLLHQDPVVHGSHVINPTLLQTPICNVIPHEKKTISGFEMKGNLKTNKLSLDYQI